MGDLDHHHGNRLLLASQVGAAKFLLLGCCGPESDLKYFFKHLERCYQYVAMVTIEANLCKIASDDLLP